MGHENVPLLEVREVTKIFDGVVRALDNVSLVVHRNEIVGVVGENGAGKSTLMKILVGVYPPDKGELYQNGEKAPFPKNPREAAKRGMALVPQERGVIPHLRVYQFICLGNERKFSKFGIIDKAAMKRQARMIVEEMRIDCDLQAFMYDLPLAQRKLVEIAKAVLSLRLECVADVTAPIVILDEPTAPLAIEQREELFEFLMENKTTTTFVFVSHIIPEIVNFADRVYVLRDGRLVASHDMSQERVSEEILFYEIVGRSLSDYFGRTSEHRKKVSDEVCLRVENLEKEGCYYDISFEVNKGECVGLFGPAGSGKSEIIKTLAGMMTYDTGVVTINGHRLRPAEGPHARLRKGIGYFSGETGKELFHHWSIARNISLLNMGKVLCLGGLILSAARESMLGNRCMKYLNIRAPSVHTLCYALSGGNKQKVSVAKWFERKPEVLLLEDPTMGIDVGAREDIYRTLLQMKKEGMTMVLVSDDPKEYATLCDKIIYIKGGRIERVWSAEEYAKALGV